MKNVQTKNNSCLLKWGFRIPYRGTQKSQKHKHKNKKKNKQQLPQMCLLKKTLIQRMDRQLQSPDLMQDKLYYLKHC